MTTILQFVDTLVPDLYDLLDSTAAVIHLEMAQAYYGVDASNESALSDMQKMILTYGTALTLVIMGLDKVRKELQKAKAGPAEAQWVDKLKSLIELKNWIKNRLDALVKGEEAFLIPPLLEKVT